MCWAISNRGEGGTGRGKRFSVRGFDYQTRWRRLYGHPMHKYRSLAAWQSAHKLCIMVLKTTDRTKIPRTWAVFDQMRRAAVSVEVNIVEGYAFGTSPGFRRHLRIAFGSAAEVEALVNIAAEMEYIQPEQTAELGALVDRTLGTVLGLLRSPGLTTRRMR